MPGYLIQFCYTQQSMKALVDRPHDRSEAARKSIEGFGGSIRVFSYCLGEWDGIVVADFPDNKSAMASLLALNAAGALAKTQTTALISSEEGVQAMRSANETKTGYTAPGA